MEKSGKKKNDDYVVARLTGKTTVSRKSRRSRISRKTKTSTHNAHKTKTTAPRPNNWNEGIPRKTRLLPPIKPVVHRPRNMILLVRSGESVRNAFPDFARDCFVPTNEHKLRYHINNINLPLSIPRRPHEEFALDPPLTEMGHFTTQALVELLVENRILIHKIYSAPSFRCVETADLLTEALHPSANDGKVCVEPTFAEYDHFPEIPAFMKPKELSMYGLKVDESYKPLAKKIKERKEHSKDVHMRVKTVMNCLHKREPIRNPIAIVATPTILQNISSCLRRDRTGKDVPVDRPTAIRMSPPSMVQVLCYEERRWRLREDLMPKFDYKYGCNWK